MGNKDSQHDDPRNARTTEAFAGRAATNWRSVGGWLTGSQSVLKPVGGLSAVGWQAVLGWRSGSNLRGQAALGNLSAASWRSVGRKVRLISVVKPRNECRTFSHIHECQFKGSGVLLRQDNLEYGIHTECLMPHDSFECR